MFPAGTVPTTGCRRTVPARGTTSELREGDLLHAAGHLDDTRRVVGRRLDDQLQDSDRGRTVGDGRCTAVGLVDGRSALDVLVEGVDRHDHAVDLDDETTSEVGVVVTTTALADLPPDGVQLLAVRHGWTKSLDHGVDVRHDGSASRVFDTALTLEFVGEHHARLAAFVEHHPEVLFERRAGKVGLDCADALQDPQVLVVLVDRGSRLLGELLLGLGDGTLRSLSGSDVATNDLGEVVDQCGVHLGEVLGVHQALQPESAAVVDDLVTSVPDVLGDEDNGSLERGSAIGDGAGEGQELTCVSFGGGDRQQLRTQFLLEGGGGCGAVVAGTEHGDRGGLGRSGGHLHAAVLNRVEEGFGRVTRGKGVVGRPVQCGQDEFERLGHHVPGLRLRLFGVVGTHRDVSAEDGCHDGSPVMLDGSAFA
jgi:hypothetical protein